MRASVVRAGLVRGATRTAALAIIWCGAGLSGAGGLLACGGGGCGGHEGGRAPAAATPDGEAIDAAEEAQRARQRQVAASRQRAGEVGWELAWRAAWDGAFEREAQARLEAFQGDTGATLSWTFALTLLLGSLVGGLVGWRRLAGSALEDRLAVLSDSRAVDRHLGAILDSLATATSPVGGGPETTAQLVEAIEGWRAANRGHRAEAAGSPTRADRIAEALESQRALANALRVDFCRTVERAEDVGLAAEALRKRATARLQVPAIEAPGPPRGWARGVGLGGLAAISLGLLLTAAWAAAGLVGSAVALGTLGAGIAGLLVAQSEVRRHGGSGILPRRVEAPAAWLLYAGLGVACLVLVSVSASVDSGMNLGVEPPAGAVADRREVPASPTLQIPGRGSAPSLEPGADPGVLESPEPDTE